MESVENSEAQQHNYGEDQEDINRPLLVKTFPNSNGGFITLPFTIGCQGLGTMAYWGVVANMIIYLTKEYGMKVANGSNIINIWEATTNFTPFLGAFLADSFVGRYPMIAYGTIVLNLGMVLFWVTTIIPGAKPTCDHSLPDLNNCTPIKPLHLIILYSSFGLIAIGSGSCRASGLAFGADQLRFKQENGALDRFFSWYFIVIYTSLITAQTCLVYIQDHSGWVIGFGVSVLLMILSGLIFFLGTPFYINSDPETSLLANLAQVVVASWRNRHYDLTSQDGIETIYHVAKASRLNMPSGKLKFLNKACVMKDGTQSPTWEGVVVDSWSTCTIDQVEELKSLINIIPLWSTGIIFNLSSAQSSFQVIQANSMNRHIFTSTFQIPSASFGIFALLTSILWLTLSNNIIPHLASKIINKPVHFNVKTRMEISIIFSILSFSIASIVENIRRKMATNEDLTRPMSALWLLPQICTMGLAGGWMITAQNEFFYSELPKSMASIASNLYYLGAAIAGFIASFIVSVIDNVSKRGNDQVSWLSNDPNKGHYDYYYALLAAFCLLNYFYFILCRRSYDNVRLCHDEPTS